MCIADEIRASAPDQAGRLDKAIEIFDRAARLSAGRNEFSAHEIVILLLTIKNGTPGAATPSASR